MISVFNPENFTEYTNSRGNVYQEYHFAIHFTHSQTIGEPTHCMEDIETYFDGQDEDFYCVKKVYETDESRPQYLGEIKELVYWGKGENAEDWLYDFFNTWAETYEDKVKIPKKSDLLDTEYSFFIWDPYFEPPRYSKAPKDAYAKIYCANYRIGINVFDYQEFITWSNRIPKSSFDYELAANTGQVFVDGLVNDQIIQIENRTHYEPIYTTLKINYAETRPHASEVVEQFENALRSKIVRMAQEYGEHIDYVPYDDFPTNLYFDEREYGIKFHDDLTAWFIQETIWSQQNFVLECNYDERQVDESVALINKLSQFNTRYDTHCNQLFLSKFNNDGDMTIEPISCELEANINDTWVLRLSCEYDTDERYTFIKEGCVIAAPAKIAREQTSDIQFFRVFTVTYNFETVDVIAFPVAMESAYDVPIPKIEQKKVTAKKFVKYLDARYRQKYNVTTDITDTTKVSIYAYATNLQEIICGDQDGAFINVFGGEVCYDNYHYILNKQLGDNTNEGRDSRLISYGQSLTDIQVVEDTVDTITRVYPMSSEGYTILPPWEQINPLENMRNTSTKTPTAHVDSKYVKNYPFPHAKCITYDDVMLINTNKVEKGKKETKTQAATRKAKSKITAYIDKHSRVYFKKARVSDWDYSKRISIKGTAYKKPQEPGYDYNQKVDRTDLPYGYILFSTEDAIGYLINQVNDSFVSVTQEEKDLFAEAIREGFKWTKKTTIAKWGWHKEALPDGGGNAYYYGTKKDDKGKSDRLRSCWWKIGNWWRWFDSDGHTNREIENWSEYKWVETGGLENIETFTDNTDSVETQKKNTEEKDTPTNPSVITKYSDDGKYKKVAKSDKTSVFGKAGDTYEYGYDGEYPSVPPNIQNGSVGSQVTLLQQFLNWYNENEALATDGICGEATENAIKAFQGTSTTLEADGIFGPATLEYAMSITKQGQHVSEMLKNVWVEDAKDKHYYVNDSGHKIIDDRVEWVWSGDEMNGLYYQAKNNGVTFINENPVAHYPVEGQFMYIAEKKAWYKFGAEGRVIGAFLSNDNWDWHKDNEGWWFGNDQGSCIKGQWLKVNSQWAFIKVNGYADTKVDDFKENSSEFIQKETPEIDYNLEGVQNVSFDETTKEKASKVKSNRDGVQAWIQKDFISEVKEYVADIHYDLWDALKAELTKRARADLRVLREESITVTCGFNNYAYTQGYEKLAFLKDFYLGDAIHVLSSKHNLDLTQRIIGIKYDCIKEEISELTLGYPRLKKSFINKLSKLNNTAAIKLYNPSDYLETYALDEEEDEYGHINNTNALRINNDDWLELGQ